MLESGLDRPVIDDTGLTGRYVLKMHTGVVDTRDFLRCCVTSLASPLHRSDAMYRYWSYVSADRASNHGMPHTHRGHRANAELTCRAEAPSLFRTLRASGLDAGCAALISVYRWPSQVGGLRFGCVGCVEGVCA